MADRLSVQCPGFWRSVLLALLQQIQFPTFRLLLFSGERFDSGAVSVWLLSAQVTIARFGHMAELKQTLAVSDLLGFEIISPTTSMWCFFKVK